ncbi:hypothetical protein HK102_003841 [Quaeritorhiza haematococci]|nr:hypothetical protein HK102_003841 [Quaeritorhiza haematococci]
MKLRGPQLVALQLGNDQDDYFENAELVPLIADHCRSLEYLRVSLVFAQDDAESLEDDLVDLVQQCGPTLRYLSITLKCSPNNNHDSESNEDEDWDVDDLDYDEDCLEVSRAILVHTIAVCCPFLCGLRLDLEDTVVSQDSAYDQDEAQKALLRNCSHLRHVRSIMHWNFWEIAAGYEAKFRALESAPWEAKEKYFDWEMYPLPTSDDLNHSLASITPT